MGEKQPWTIRPATAEDADALSLVGCATFLETYAGWVDGQAIVDFCRSGHSADAYRAYLNKGAQAWLATVEPGGAPVGYALNCAADLEAAQEGDWELRRIYVLARFHGTGLASALMNAAVEGAHGHARLLVGVKDDNTKAIAFYRKHGFADVGTRQFQVGRRTYSDLVLARTL